MNKLLQWLWYRNRWAGWLLSPLALLLLLIITLRRWLYRWPRLRWRSPKPLLVVGNLTVGGTGKTPLVIALCAELQARGWQPGIVSRGYRGNRNNPPSAVDPNGDCDAYGDEPLLLAKRSGCPVVIGVDRPAAVRLLLRQNPHCDVVLSDDGLQHYALERDVEILLVDGIRHFGNRLLLPAGPLREPPWRQRTVDFIVCPNGAWGWPMALHGDTLYRVNDSAASQSLSRWQGKTVHAVAGIGQPQSFFDTLRHHDLQPLCHPFPDHHRFVASNINFSDDLPVLMTEKDALKCRSFATEKHWFLPVSAALESGFFAAVHKRITMLKDEQKTARPAGLPPL